MTQRSIRRESFRLHRHLQDCVLVPISNALFASGMRFPLMLVTLRLVVVTFVKLMFAIVALVA